MEYKKPLPVVTQDSRPFWEAAWRGELVMNRCTECNEIVLLQKPLGETGCPVHGDRHMEWTLVSGKGTVYSFVIFHRPFLPSFAPNVPYNVSIIELDEGPLFISSVVECPNDEIRIGMPVEVVFDPVTEEIALPKFRRATAG